MSSAAYGEADKLLEDVAARLSPHPMDGTEAVAAAVVGAGRAILALVDEVEPVVELLRVLVEQHRVVELGGLVDGPRIRSHVVERLDGGVPFVEDPDPLAHDHAGPCVQCHDVKGGTCCPHCSGARIGTARGSVGGRT